MILDSGCHFHLYLYIPPVMVISFRIIVKREREREREREGMLTFDFNKAARYLLQIYILKTSSESQSLDFYPLECMHQQIFGSICFGFFF
jgi:hypothetical protein